MTASPASRQLPDRVTMGLLPYLNAHAVDEDYAEAAARRADAGARPAAGERRRFGPGGAVVLVVFAVLAVTAAVQTSQDSATEEKQRQGLITQVKENRAVVAGQRQAIVALEQETRSLESALLAGNEDTTGLLAQVSLLGLRSGTTPVRGPGVEVVVDDAPNAASDREKVLDSDLQKLVNGLWQAGAEAISINGERLTALSAIRHAGSAITVNLTSLERPYRVLAIGDKDRLASRFADTSSGAAWFDLQQQVGLRFEMRPESTLRLPGADVPDLRYVRDEAGTDQKRKGLS